MNEYSSLPIPVPVGYIHVLVAIVPRWPWQKQWWPWQKLWWLWQKLWWPGQTREKLHV